MKKEILLCVALAGAIGLSSTRAFAAQSSVAGCSPEFPIACPGGGCAVSLDKCKSASAGKTTSTTPAAPKK